MEIDILVLLFSATLYPIVILVRLHPLSSLIGTYWGRNKVTHQSTQPEKINFALQEGQTIVGVMDTTRTMCFYIVKIPTASGCQLDTFFVLEGLEL